MPTASSHRLTPKQEWFCLAYLDTGNASAAYREAYDVRVGTKPSTVWCSASQLLQNPSVGHRIEELQRRTAERHKITIDTLSGQLQQAYALAKLHGLFVNRAEVKAREFVVSDTPEGLKIADGPPEQMSEEAWERKYGQAA